MIMNETNGTNGTDGGKHPTANIEQPTSKATDSRLAIANSQLPIANCQRKVVISICMIVGTAVEYIERCWRSFALLGVEICMVRAVGGVPTDGTLERAREVAREVGLPLKFAEYRNGKGREDWPHVDDFAAARQMSFDLAAGEYCFWVDTDDVLDETVTAGQMPWDVVRGLAERGGFAAVVMPYRIFGRGVSVPRERMIAKDAGRWRYPVHECFKFHIEPVQAIEDNRVVVVHMPHLDKKGSSERNLRILRSIPEAEMTPGLLYHLQGELALAGDVTGSVQVAQRALKSPELGRAERYELFLNLAQLATDERGKETMLVQAYAADPRRREALGLLACHSMDYGKYDLAMAYARQMAATLRPAVADWNHRDSVYSWLGDEIYTQALRVNGFAREAEILRREILNKAGGARIALVHATRGRPQKAALTRKVWLDLAERPEAVEHIFVMDADDDASVALQRMNHLVVPPGGGCVRAWNDGCAMTHAPVVVQLSDDWMPVPMWDRLILERIGDARVPRVLAISDGVREDALLCMAICTRAYLELDWFLFHPEFTGVYSDNWFTELAYRRGAVIEAQDLRFVHEHPLKTGAQPDETYLRQNAPERYAEGKAIYERLRSGGDWSFVPGFYNYWQFYRLVAERLQDGDVVAEVGVWFGRSIIHLAQMLKRQGKRVRILAVDHFKGELNQPAHEKIVAAAGASVRWAFELNVRECGVGEMIEVLDGDSAEMAARVADGSLAFCYIDAAHDYESVRRDLAAWGPKVKTGGMMAGHDAQHGPVMRAVRERWKEAVVLGPVWVGEVGSLTSNSQLGGNSR